MGNLSFHFNHKDFACKCEMCRGKGEYRIHLGLVGALEMIYDHFNKPLKIISAYRCEACQGKGAGSKKDVHGKGKAVDIAIEGIDAVELFKFAETVPELKGIGFYPEGKYVHIDTRQGDREEWVKEGENHVPLTSEKRKRYNLE